MRQPLGIALALVLAIPFVVAAQQVPVFRAGVDLVNLGVTVTDKRGNLVTDLTAADFEINEDGKKQTPRYVAGGDAANPARRCTSACWSTSAKAWART